MKPQKILGWIILLIGISMALWMPADGRTAANMPGCNAPVQCTFFTRFRPRVIRSGRGKPVAIQFWQQCRACTDFCTGRTVTTCD